MVLISVTCVSVYFVLYCVLCPPPSRLEKRVFLESSLDLTERNKSVGCKGLVPNNETPYLNLTAARNKFC